MQSHTGCICLTFLHCAFFNVSPNRLPEWMQSHSGCICLTFLHCAFSNVSLNCPRGCIITLVALIWHRTSFCHSYKTFHIVIAFKNFLHPRILTSALLMFPGHWMFDTQTGSDMLRVLVFQFNTITYILEMWKEKFLWSWYFGSSLFFLSE